MSTRFQWFSVKPLRQRELKAATDRFLGEKYEDSRGYGFILSEVRPTFITGQFIEKTLLKELVVDPFGKESVFEIPQYHKLSFRLAATYPQLELVNPLRSLGQFLTFLGDCLENQVTIDPIEWGLETVCGALKQKANNLILQRANVTNIVLSNTVSAEVGISGTDDVSRYIPELIGKRKSQFSGARLRFDVDGKVFCSEWSSSGRIRLLLGDENVFSDFARKILANMQT